MSAITRRVEETLVALPAHVTLVVAAKTRSADEVRDALRGGARVVGHNYVQEAEAMIAQLGREAASWTLIGHLQRNKVKRAVQLFDSVQTVDSLRLAETIDRQCRAQGRVMPILIEVNAAQEPQKAGVWPENVVDLVRELGSLSSIRFDGLMTMGPWTESPESLRPFFRDVKSLFDRMAADTALNAHPRVLSMGMSDSYQVAIEEGATMIRLGTTLFGPRQGTEPV